MGGNVSKETPVPDIPDSFVVISISGRSRVRAMNATPDVVELLSRLDQEIQAKTGNATPPLKEYFGTQKMHVGGYMTFARGAGKEAGVLGKFFVLRLFEEMYALGYNLVISSDLARRGDNATWFFTKSVMPATRSTRVCCIAPGGAMNDKLSLLRHDEHVKQALLLAIADCWPKGTDSIDDVQVLGENYCEVKLHGYWGATHEDGINTRKLICNMVGRMGGLNWRLIASTNLKGTADSYFFMQDPSYTAHPNEMAMISLSKRDRMRLINCNQLIEPLTGALQQGGLVVQEQIDYFGCLEVKIEGSPWHSMGEEATQARRGVSRALEMMAANGFVPYYAIDVTKSITDKASILFKKEPYPMNCRFACLSLTSVNRIRLLDFPLDVGVPMRDSIYQNYTFGVQGEVNLPEGNLSVDLNGWPWTVEWPSKGSASYHAKAMLGRMMRIAEQHGWNVVLSADVSARTAGGGNDAYPLDVHTIYFMKVLAPA